MLSQGENILRTTCDAFQKNLLVIKAYDDVQAKNRESSCAIGGIAQPLSEEHVLLTH